MPYRTEKDSIPRFIQIANDLENQIIDGLLELGDSLPKFKELAKKFDVSLVTINHSIKELYARGRVVRKRGKGVFVGSREHHKQNSYLVGLVVPDIANPYFSLLAKMVQKHLIELGYALIIQSTDGDIIHMIHSLRQLLNRKVDGILIVPLEINFPEHEEILWKLKLQRIPFVYVNDHISRVPSDYIEIDLAQGVNLIADHLIKLGHRKIGCVSAEPYINITTTKVRNLVARLKESGLDLNSENVFISDKQHEEGGYEAALQMLKGNDPPTAIVATSDIIAAGVIQAVKSLNLNVPRDVSVVGIDDIDIAHVMEPQLTTVKQPVEKMAEKAVEILIKRIEGKISSDYQYYVFSPELVVRDSTKAINNST